MNAQTASPVRVTLADVRDSFNTRIPEAKSMSWFGRPLANLVTPFFYNSGWTANQVTAFRTLVAVIAVLLLFLGTWHLIVTATALFYVVFVLDCVDGNIARIRGSTSYWGKFADGLSDYIFPVLAPVAIGLAAWGDSDGILILTLAFGCAMMSLASQMVRARLSFMREWMVSQSGPIDDRVQQELAGVHKLQSRIAVVYINGNFLAPLLLLVDDGGRSYIYALIAVQMVPEGVWLISSLVEARKLLQRLRTSIHAVPKPD